MLTTLSGPNEKPEFRGNARERESIHTLTKQNMYTNGI